MATRTVSTRKAFSERSLKVSSRSNRWKAGTRRNKRDKTVPTFNSDKQKD